MHCEKPNNMILVTGATGLVGSHLLYRLIAAGNTVRILVRDKRRLSGIRKVFSYYTSDVEHLMGKVEILEGDLLDYDKVELATEGVSGVYHCAATVSFSGSRGLLTELNTAMAANVVNACLSQGVERMVHVSSTSATGTEQGAMITEDSEWRYSRHISGYSISKFESEREAWRAEAEGLGVVIVNPAMVLGPGNWGESSTSLIDRCYKGISFYTDGINAFVDVRDVAEIMVRLMNSDISGEKYILAAGNISFRSFFDQVTASLGRPGPRFRAGRWMAEVVWRLEWLRSKINRSEPLITKETARTALSSNLYSSEKIKKHLDFEFRPLSETIRWTCEHYLRDKGLISPDP